MAIDAVFPAASELVMLYAGAVASGALAGQNVVLFGHRLGDLGLRVLRRRLGPRRELGTPPRALPLRRLRGRGARGRRDRRARVEAREAGAWSERIGTRVHSRVGMIPLVDVKAQYAPL